MDLMDYPTAVSLAHELAADEEPNLAVRNTARWIIAAAQARDSLLGRPVSSSAASGLRTGIGLSQLWPAQHVTASRFVDNRSPVVPLMWLVPAVRDAMRDDVARSSGSMPSVGVVASYSLASYDDSERAEILPLMSDLASRMSVMGRSVERLASGDSSVGSFLCQRLYTEALELPVVLATDATVRARREMGPREARHVDAMIDVMERLPPAVARMQSAARSCAARIPEARGRLSAAVDEVSGIAALLSTDPDALTQGGTLRMGECRYGGLFRATEWVVAVLGRAAWHREHAQAILHAGASGSWPPGLSDQVTSSDWAGLGNTGDGSLSRQAKTAVWHLRRSKSAAGLWR